jgi:hypothetical protein
MGTLHRETPTEPTAAINGWPKLKPAALCGLAGDVVRIIAPHTEADDVAVLAQFLTAFGNAVGRHAHFVAESRPHYTNINTVLVGETAKGRKGSSLSNVARVFSHADPRWLKGQVAHGLASGEGLIWRVRDPIYELRAVKEKGRSTGEYEDVLIDPGVDDKRLLVIEEEYAQVLAVMTRQGNTLSPVIRQCWDTGELATMTKNSPAKASRAHVSIVGHVTRDELVRNVTATEAANGFINRFLFIAVRRSKLLPDGGNLTDEELEPVANRVFTVLEFGRFAGMLTRTADARTRWHEVYEELSEGKPGLLGAAIARAEAQTMRLAVIYALLDGSEAVRVEHLDAALALWDYAEASARWVFGDTLGDPVADTILAALRRASGGMTRTDINILFAKNRPAGEIEAALASLAEKGLAHMSKETTGGRPAERWKAGHAA